MQWLEAHSSKGTGSFWAWPVNTLALSGHLASHSLFLPVQSPFLCIICTAWGRQDSHSRLCFSFHRLSLFFPLALNAQPFYFKGIQLLLGQGKTRHRLSFPLCGWDSAVRDSCCAHRLLMCGIFCTNVSLRLLAVIDDLRCMVVYKVWEIDAQHTFVSFVVQFNFWVLLLVCSSLIRRFPHEASVTELNNAGPDVWWKIFKLC